MQGDWIYDIETYRDIFCVAVEHAWSNKRFIFEVSDRYDHSRHFAAFIQQAAAQNCRLFGFNNEFFDYPVIHHMLRRASFTALDAHQLANAIISSRDRFAYTVWPSDRMITQGDLFKIHHFDNVARSTSLKRLEINMRSARVVDLPYPPGVDTTSAQKDEIVAYMCHDVSETKRFYHQTIDQIKFRDNLAVKYPKMGDVLNMNDTKIGKKFFEMHLSDAGVQLYDRSSGRRMPRQTSYETLPIGPLLSPKLTFTHPEFQRVHRWFDQLVLGRGKDGRIETNGAIKDVHATVGDLTYHFGLGGIHASHNNRVTHSDDTHVIIDVDVASFYPNIAIVNGFFPKHLSDDFCRIYQDVYKMRRSYAKGTAENAMLKLALNGVYGSSNDKWSIFCDPGYTMAVTVNGQLFLAMLAERLWSIGADVVQANTDGVTVRIHRDSVSIMRQVCKQWEAETGFELEDVEYRSMYIRDVNNYIAVTNGGKCKRKGDYTYETALENPYTQDRPWHKDHSALVVPKAAEAAMVTGGAVEDFVKAHRDAFDFMLCAKVPRSSRLEAGGVTIQNTTRYYVSTDGVHLTKIMPPLKDQTADRRISIQAGYTVTICNDASDFRWENVNWYYYINEAKKLVLT